MYIDIYYVPDKNEFYHKIVKYEWHTIGYVNSYGHRLMYHICINDFIYTKRHKLRRRILRSIIRFFEVRLVNLDRKG